MWRHICLPVCAAAVFMSHCDNRDREDSSKVAVVKCREFPSLSLRMPSTLHKQFFHAEYYSQQTLLHRGSWETPRAHHSSKVATGCHLKSGGTAIKMHSVHVTFALHVVFCCQHSTHINQPFQNTYRTPKFINGTYCKRYVSPCREHSNFLAQEGHIWTVL